MGNLKVERHKKLCEDMNALYERKNHDYGDSFGKCYREWTERFESSFGTKNGGLIMVSLRLEDKLNRIKALAFKQQSVSDESIRDTLVDLSNYALMTVLEMDMAQEEPKDWPAVRNSANGALEV